MTELLVSIVFKPDDKAINEVKGLYEAVQAAFPSAEIEPAEFEVRACELSVHANQLDTLIASLTELLRYEHAQYVYLDSYTIAKAERKLSLTPTSQSRGYLLEKIRKITAELSQFVPDIKRFDPYLLLATELPAERYTEIDELPDFKVIDVDFRCNGVELRVVDDVTGKLLEEREIPFGNEKEFGLEHGQFKMF